jgi:acyl-coenzyme A thioesterase PaaI-like protein
MTPSRLRHLMNLWPPFLFTGIRVLAIGADWRSARVVLRKRWYNRNAVGVHFGGSLFAMTDPFWMILIGEGLGRDYRVWDQAATIDFVAPGRTDVSCDFLVTDAALDDLRSAAADGSKVLRWFDCDVKAPDGSLVARVRKQIYVRRKRDAPADPGARARHA